MAWCGKGPEQYSAYRNNYNIEIFWLQAVSLFWWFFSLFSIIARPTESESVS